MYFYYRRQLSGSHSVFYIETSELVMLPYARIRRHNPGNKAHCHNVRERYGIGSGVQQRRQQTIIGRQLRQHPATECPAVLHLLVMVLHPAFFTAIPLVSPSIKDLFAAVQALRQDSQFSFVLHQIKTFSFKYRYKVTGKAIDKMQVFLFFKKIFTNL